MPLGALAFGKLIPHFGVQHAIAGGGLALVLIAVYFLVFKSAKTFQPGAPPMAAAESSA